MLLLKGKLSYRNLNTAYTNLDQFIAGLQKERFTGFCTLSFWEYEAIMFFLNGRLLNGQEIIGITPKTIRHGENAVANILKKGHEKNGEINAYALPEDRAAMLSGALDAAPKYENLSTDLTSLDKLIALAAKEALSGYIEVQFENKGGIANLFFVDGELIEAVFAESEQEHLAEARHVKDVLDLCQTHGALFTVYQAPAMSVEQGQGQVLQGTVPEEALRLMEVILNLLERIVDAALKTSAFDTELKKMLPRMADKYTFLDPFLGDFKYANHTLTYRGDATYKEFIEGMSAVVNNTLAAVFEKVAKTTLLPRISEAFEPLTLTDSDLIAQLHLEQQMPDLFQDYRFLKDRESEGPGQEKNPARSILNLQGVGVPDIGADSILREFYRVIGMLIKKYVSADGLAIQYAALKKSADYQQYQTATVFLQNFEVSVLKTREESLAFWLNLYNFLTIDGILKAGVTTSVQDVKGFFAKTSYRLGEYVFSLDDIEHGILRNNQRRPYATFRPFSGADPRKALCLNPPENRVHACLAGGVKSSPLLALYAPQQLEHQLTQAMQRFLSAGTGLRIDRSKQELWLHRRFYWYRKDFEQTDKSLLDYVLKYLEDVDQKKWLAQQRDKLTLRFMEYDWNLNQA